LSHDLQLTTWPMNYAGDTDTALIPNHTSYFPCSAGVRLSKVCMSHVPGIELPLKRGNCSWCLANILPPGSMRLKVGSLLRSQQLQPPEKFVDQNESLPLLLIRCTA